MESFRRLESCLAKHVQVLVMATYECSFRSGITLESENGHVNGLEIFSIARLTLTFGPGRPWRPMGPGGPGWVLIWNSDEKKTFYGAYEFRCRKSLDAIYLASVALGLTNSS